MMTTTVFDTPAARFALALAILVVAVFALMPERQTYTAEPPTGWEQPAN